MLQSKIINLSYGDIAPVDMTLKLECFSEELSEAQLASYQKAEDEHNNIKSEFNRLISSTTAENLFLGEVFSAYQVSGVVTGLDRISKPVAVVRKENKARQIADERRLRADREREAVRKRENAKLIEVIEDDDDEEYLPLSKRMAAKKTIPPPKVQTRGKLPVPVAEKLTNRPSEASALGGLTIGTTKKKDVVDLTKEDVCAATKLSADSREVTFNKLQGKTFPSLVVVARPTLKAKDSNINDRPALDAKVKGVLMHSATKYTEWLIQQGLVRSEQMCQVHSKVPLKLGMYSDASKFPYSGGYVWISDCCPSRFVSVFSGSIFEGSPNPPSVLLKLIYHWSCQTNVQNVVQWVKVDNLYVKGLFTWLRSVCTVALHQHMTLLGGPGKRIEVGVISLGTTSQGGQQKQVKVEVLGVLDPVSKIVRLRAVEPLADGEKNYKKRFAKILEPLSGWVHKSSIIATDLTVDKGTLASMGYKFVNQSTTSDGKYTNSNIMEYLRTVVPRMFQNTLSLLSRQIIQQFLDELVWREWYGTTPGKTFDHIVSHISEQTRLDAAETLIIRLNRVSANPFRDWSHLSVKSPAKALRSDLFSAGSSNAVQCGNVGRPQLQRPKRKETTPPPAPVQQKKQKIIIKEEPKSYKVKLPPKRDELAKKETKIFLESFYYGLYETGTDNDSGGAVNFEANCPECKEVYINNIDFMDHLKRHAAEFLGTTAQIHCRYCLKLFADNSLLEEHILSSHPIQTNDERGSFKCLICRLSFSTVQLLGQHMDKQHVTAELPFKCGCCDHMSSSQRFTTDHFYNDHTASGALQCPFCMKIFIAVANDEQLSANIKDYYKHLKAHLVSDKAISCSKCSLRFLSKGPMKAHRIFDHISHNSLQRHLRELCKESVSINKPKLKNFAPREPITPLSSCSNIVMCIGNGQRCLECGDDFEEVGHYRNISKCAKCKFQTACSRSILEHTTNCNGEANMYFIVTSQLGDEWFCVCGYSSSEGNDLARHLATCDRNSAYDTSELAQENTVKCNMLDMLGLVRRDGEDEEDSSDLLIPADQQQQLLSRSINRETENSDRNQHSNLQNNHQAQTAPNAIDDFNTQLSLDDLAPPQSVAPQTEPDRTPQLSDEYQICQLWNFSIISVLALTISNVLLTIRLLHKTDCVDKEHRLVSRKNIRFQYSSNLDESSKIHPYAELMTLTFIDDTDDQKNRSQVHRLVFDDLDLKNGRWDAGRQYKFFDFATVGSQFNKLSEKYKVCLSTQSSIERLYSLPSVAEHWSGPISLAVFVAGDDELYLLQLYLSYLRNCFPNIRNAVNIHLTYPKNRAPSIVRKHLKKEYDNFICDQPEHTLKKLMKFRTSETVKWRLRNAYPQNHLRNLARKGCQSDFVFLTDIDIIPSANFTEHLDKFLRKSQCTNESKCAYVVPTYEVDYRAKFPQNKADLIRLTKKGLARPFHHKVFIYNQFATNFSRWESNMGSANADTTISHNVTNFEFLYEPFYVSSDSVPPHDERFMGYGFTRNTQVYEMFVAGYHFQVLTPIFTCHWGLQNKKSRPAWRERQNNLNRKQFEVFKKEIYARYHRDPLKMLQPRKSL